jgi:hypothetical protein
VQKELPELKRVQNFGTGPGASGIFYIRTTAHTNSANYLTAVAQGNATCKDHHSTSVGNVDPIKWAARLAIFRKLCSLHIESSSGLGLVNRDINCPDAGIVHSRMGNEIASGVDNGDVHVAIKRFGFGFRGENDAPGDFEIEI